MKKTLISILFVVLLIIAFFSGCTEESQTDNSSTEQSRSSFNIGDSLTVEELEYTFLSAKWVNRSPRPYWGYQIKIKCKNEGSTQSSSTILSTLYITENGDEIEPKSNDGHVTGFTIKPGSESTITIECKDSTLDRDLPIEEVYITIGVNNEVYNHIKLII